ncbi:MAG: MFS transporter, partial [Desulfuromonadales bacterium]
LHLLGLRILQGAGLALEIPPTLALLAIFSRRQTRGGSMGFYTTLRITGLSLGPLIGGYLHVYFGIDAAFFGGTAILLLAALLVQFGVKPVAAPKSASCARYSPRFDLSLLSPGILSAAVATFLSTRGSASTLSVSALHSVPLWSAGWFFRCLWGASPTVSGASPSSLADCFSWPRRPLCSGR